MIMIIDVALVNSFIIHKSIGGKLDHIMYRVNLAKSLIAISEMQLNPAWGVGHPQKSDVRAAHCPTPIKNERLNQKSTKASVV